ncbi:hypothetical protein IWZ03DRAFT_174365 [Phyllosticta citriasiana]|uniref:Uncharacterized protein n=1 Tax=Phyllosticta citriasiana TaxID=595635 RepID=A0ABR1KRW7_9PEZI
MPTRALLRIHLNPAADRDSGGDFSRLSALSTEILTLCCSPLHTGPVHGGKSPVTSTTTSTFRLRLDPVLGCRVVGQVSLFVDQGEPLVRSCVQVCHCPQAQPCLVRRLSGRRLLLRSTPTCNSSRTAKSSGIVRPKDAMAAAFSAGHGGSVRQTARGSAMDGWIPSRAAEIAFRLDVGGVVKTSRGISGADVAEVQHDTLWERFLWIHARQ